MKKFIVSLFLVYLFNLLSAQNSNLDFKFSLKIYNLSSYEEYSKTTNESKQTTTSLKILHPTIAFQWTSGNKNNHEIELTNFSFGKHETTTEIIDTSNYIGKPPEHDLISTSISVRYEYIINFNKGKDTKIVPSVGLGINPYYTQNNLQPKTTSQFPYSESYLGTKLFLTPRLSFYLTSRFFLDINLPICISDIYYSVDKNENPGLELDQRTKSTFEIQLFPKVVTGRIGIGIKI